MPQDPNLYGQRPPKRQKKMPLSSSLDFSAQLTSLMESSANPRPSVSTATKLKPAKSSAMPPSQSRTKLRIKDVAGTEEESDQLERARRRLEEKARLYSAMKRGDYISKKDEPTPLIDFDRKWAESSNQPPSDCSTSDSDGEEEGDEPLVEYEDEFGRLRRGTKADKDRMERRLRRGLLGLEESEKMAARPKAPEKVIHGDTIQTMAFVPEDSEKMEELARKRDRSPTPPDMKHYDADKEIRTKGVGFYKFSKDEERRTQEMNALEAERLQTEKERQQREEKRLARRRELEDRRKEIEARRAQKRADTFLSGLATELTDVQQ